MKNHHEPELSRARTPVVCDNEHQSSSRVKRAAAAVLLLLVNGLRATQRYVVATVGLVVQTSPASGVL